MATRRTGTTGADTITAVDAADTLAGGAGNDIYIVNSLLNVIEELPYYFEPGAGGVTLPGGNDTVRTAVLDRLNTFSLGKWAHVENLQFTGTVAAMLVGNSGNNVILANSASVTNDTLSGGAGNDTLSGYGGNDSLIGGVGDDLLNGGVGSDTMIGGAGNDTYVLDSVFDVAIETATGGSDTLSSSGTVKDLRVSKFANFENLVYTHATVAALLSGDAGGNRLESLSSGNDTVYGWAGNDTLIGGAGNDVLVGAEGDDSLVGGVGNDSLLGGEGDDWLVGDTGIDTLIGGNGDDVYVVDTSDVVTELVNGGEDSLIGTKTSLALTPAIENLFYTGTTGASLVGNALNNTIGGGIGADSISTGDGHDWLYGGNSAGIDYSLVALLGVDLPTVVSDKATDTLIGGLGDDHYLVDDALDVVVESVGAGDDVLESYIDNSLKQAQYANVENLVLLRNTAFQPWFGEGNAGANVIVGSSDENYLAGGAGNDTLVGTPLDSYYSSSQITDVLDGGEGNDVLLSARYYSSIYSYTSYGSILLGGAGNDFFVVDNPDNTEVYDSLGTDTVYLLQSGNLQTSQGIERIVLSGGGTLAEYNQALAAWNAVLGVTDNDPITALSDTSAVNATGNDEANTIVGNTYSNNLAGLAGNDTIYGNAGNDTLDGGDGNDSLIGGLGDDTYVLATGDVIEELAGQGIDTVKSATLTSAPVIANIEGFEYTGSSNVLLQYGTSNTTPDRLTGGSGNDTINGHGGNDTLNGGLGTDSLTGGDGQDNLTGGGGADRLFGEAGIDVIFGDDSIYFGTSSVTGNDTIDGGADNDQIGGGNGNDSILGGTGADTLYGGYNYGATTGEDNDTLDGGADNDQIEGGNGNDSILGGSGADRLYGDAGNDTLDGGADNDTVYGGSDNDSMLGGTGADYLGGDAGNDILSGGLGFDNLAGGAGNDTLIAGGGDPLASVSSYWGSGDDLTGDDYSGPGADVFRFEATAGYGTSSDAYYGVQFATGDQINDFGAGDKIQFARALVGDGDALLENVALKAAAGGTFAKTAEMVIVQANMSDLISASTGYWQHITASAVVAQIGNADAAFALGDKRLFVVDDGNDSAIFQFTSAGADAVVSDAELELIAVVNYVSTLSSTDFFLY
jgi:Ca2+-binding RTX toxin-like protein